MAYEFQEYRLNNGLRVGLKRTPTETVAGSIRSYLCPNHEKLGEEGYAHLLEHLFMSCYKKPLVGSFNAATNSGDIWLTGDVCSEDVSLFLESLAQKTLEPDFKPSIVEEEKAVVIQEFNQKISNVSYLYKFEFRTALLGLGAPQNYFILGKEESLRKATPESIRAFHQRGFHPNNMELVLAGGLPGNIEEIIEDKFGRYPFGPDLKFVFPKPRELQEKKVICKPAPHFLNAENPEKSSALLMVGFQVPDETHPDERILRTAIQILGSKENSRLFQSVRQKKGLAYTIQGNYNGDNNSASCVISAIVHAPRIEEALDSIYKVLDGMKTDPVPLIQMELWKKQSKYEILKFKESNLGHINIMMANWSEGFDPDKALEKIDSFTPEDVMGCAGKYFPSREDPHVVYVRNPLLE
jgi:predicted Zn-dependent peptidase